MAQSNEGDAFRLGYSSFFSADIMLDAARRKAATRLKVYTEQEVVHLLEQRGLELTAEMERAVEQAAAAAYERGRTDNERTQRELLARAIEYFEKEKDFYDQIYNDHIEQIKPLMLDMVFEIAAKIVGISVDSPEIRDRLKSEIQLVFDSIREDEAVILEVSELDYPFISDAFGMMKRVSKITLVSDSTLLRGEFRFRTEEKQVMKIYLNMISDFRESVTFNRSGIHEQQKSEKHD